MLGLAGNEYFDTHTAGLTTNENWPGIGINLNRKLVREYYFVYAEYCFVSDQFCVGCYICLYIALDKLEEEKKDHL